MTKIFLSYRRGDSADVTGRIDDRLIAEFGRENVFKDVDSIPLGMDFRTHLSDAVGGCDVLLVVIGEGWLSAQDANGNPRLEDPSDFVRIEVESALKRDIQVVPVLLGGAEMPREDQLPDVLSELAYRNGTKVRPDPDFHLDMDRMLASIKQFGSAPSAAPKEAPAPVGLITTDCQCGRTLRAPEKMAGKRAPCPACGAVVQIPAGADAAVAGVPATARSRTRMEQAAQPHARTERSSRKALWVSLGALAVVLAGVGAWVALGNRLPWEPAAQPGSETASAPSTSSSGSAQGTPPAADPAPSGSWQEVRSDSREISVVIDDNGYFRQTEPGAPEIVGRVRISNGVLTMTHADGLIETYRVERGADKITFFDEDGRQADFSWQRMYPAATASPAAAAPQHVERGKALLDQGLWAEAIPAFRLALENDPSSAEARRYLDLATGIQEGLRRRGHDQWKESVEVLRQTVALDPDVHIAQEELGMALLLYLDSGEGSEDELVEAVAVLRRAVATNPECAVARAYLGRALLYAGTLQEAAGELRRAIQDDPSCYDARMDLGRALLALEEPAEAATALRGAIALEAESAEAWEFLGDALRHSGDLGGAESAYRQAITFDAQHPYAHDSLGHVLGEQGRWEEAVSAFRRAVEIHGQEPDEHEGLQRALGELARRGSPPAEAGLQWRLTPEDRIQIVLEERQVFAEMDFSMEMRQEFIWSITGGQGDGSVSISMTTNRIEYSDSSGVAWDSDEDDVVNSEFLAERLDDPEQKGEWVVRRAQLVGGPVTFQLDPRGEVSGFRLSHSLAQAMRDSATYTKDALQHSILGWVVVLDSAALADRRSWQRQRTYELWGGTVTKAMTYQYSGSAVRGGRTLEEIDATGTMTLEPGEVDVRGTLRAKSKTWFDRAAGRMVGSSMEGQFTLNMQGMEASGTMTATVRVESASLAGVYDVNLDSMVDAAMKSSLAELEEEPTAVELEAMREGISAMLRQARLTLTLGANGDFTYECTGIPGTPDEHATGTWSDDADSFTLVATHLNREESAEVLKGSVVGGQLILVDVYEGVTLVFDRR